MSALVTDVRHGEYADSIVLMQLQAALAREPGVEDAAVVMATPANLDLLAESGLLTDEAAAARPDDLAIVVKGASRETALSALARVGELMRRRGEADDADFRPRTLRSAERLLPDAGWVLVSVPGRYAGGVAREALALGRHVFLYSDNVPLEEEVELKRRGAERGLLVMGPDCGTAIVGGVGLGFANRVRRGPIGVVGASGTGIQAITTRIDALGGGISQAIGTGGRDLSAEVGGATARQALDLLARDPETEVVVLVSKPPAPEVAVDLLAAARRTGKPVVVQLFGWVPPARRQGNLLFAAGTSDAAALAVAAAADSGATGADPASGRPAGKRRFLRALLAGGTLAYETQIGLRAAAAPLRSNVPIAGSLPLEDLGRSVGHTVLDLGADELTVGRAHPMIDPDLRLRRLRQEADDPEAAFLLLDVVLGEGAHPDPAAALAPAVERIVAAGGPEVVAGLVGAPGDRQQIEEQMERLRAAGTTVFDDFAAALGWLADRLTPEPTPVERPVSLDSLRPPLAALNVGLELFYDSLVDQGARAVQVEWRPPAGGDERLAAILRRLQEDE
ncbi:MAG: acyl-CoA synthetase FdrA [Thermoanaerobaculia bacterium]|nr:acyl-CoA synthetase FdrA [Thermoanaerobaculia bacterium]